MAPYQPDLPNARRSSRKASVLRMPKRKKTQKVRRPPALPSTDRHWLYQESVQSPEEHVVIFDRMYTAKHGRPASLLKEDFCGTAFLSAAWVRERPNNVAIGVDLDEATLAWGRDHNIAPLKKDERARITLIRDDVLHVTRPQVDILAALNFSYCEFKTRDALRAYFEGTRRSLKPDGILILDLFGGWEAQMEVTDKTRNDGFTYVWEQTSFDPLTHLTQFHIHFRFRGGGGIEKAFEYNWRLWTMPEIRELLAEAGFAKVDVYWEQIDDDTNEGNGEFELVTEAENCPGWVAMIAAHPK